MDDPKIVQLREANKQLRARISELQELMTYQWEKHEDSRACDGLSEDAACNNSCEFRAFIDIGHATFEIFACSDCVQKSAA